MRTWLITPFLLMLPLTMQAMDRNEANGITTMAQEAYALSDHRQALLLYDSVHAAGFTSSALLHNIGNCHFKLGDIPRAILNYERALRLSPDADDVRANLDLARQQVVDRLPEPTGLLHGTTWANMRSTRDLDTWTRRTLWVWAMMFLFLATALLVGQRALRRTLFAAAGVLLVVTVAFAALAAYRNGEVNDQEQAIIMAPKVDVRSEPKAGSTVLVVLHKGTKVSIQQEQEAWYEVRLPNGTVGWMPEGSVERI